MPRAQFYNEPAQYQIALDQTRIALALEAQKRSTGSYPESLATLPPGLPRDVATGQPYRYEKSPDGSFRLWSTDLDQADNGGVSGKDIVYGLPKPK